MWRIKEVDAARKIANTLDDAGLDVRHTINDDRIYVTIEDVTYAVRVSAQRSDPGDVPFDAE